jgi:hypothetical protein
VLENLAVPVGNRNGVRASCDAVPQGLQVVELLVDGQLVETRRPERNGL